VLDRSASIPLMHDVSTSPRQDGTLLGCVRVAMTIDDDAMTMWRRRVRPQWSFNGVIQIWNIFSSWFCDICK